MNNTKQWHKVCRDGHTHTLSHSTEKFDLPVLANAGREEGNICATEYFKWLLKGDWKRGKEEARGGEKSLLQNGGKE